MAAAELVTSFSDAEERYRGRVERRRSRRYDAGQPGIEGSYYYVDREHNERAHDRHLVNEQRRRLVFDQMETTISEQV